MEEFLGVKGDNRMECHLKDVKTQQNKLFDMLKGSASKVDPIVRETFTVSTCQKRLAEIKQNVEEEHFNIVNSLEVDEEELYLDLTDDQIVAADYFLNTIRSLDDSGQLLMLLHGQPGSGKSFT